MFYLNYIVVATGLLASDEVHFYLNGFVNEQINVGNEKMKIR